MLPCVRLCALGHDRQVMGLWFVESIGDAYQITDCIPERLRFAGVWYWTIECGEASCASLDLLSHPSTTFTPYRDVGTLYVLPAKEMAVA